MSLPLIELSSRLIDKRVVVVVGEWGGINKGIHIVFHSCILMTAVIPRLLIKHHYEVHDCGRERSLRDCRGIS